jgi:protein phosphatase
LRSQDIQNIVASNPDLSQACDELIAEANNRGGEDNITVILARFSGDELEDPSSDRITIELPTLEEDKTLDETYDPDTEPR